MIAFFPFWAAVGAIFWLERVTTVWRAGWKARGLAALLFVELGYDMFLQAVYVKSLLDIATGQAREWNHVDSSQPAEAHVIAAILPTSVLDSAWFELLAAFVAFNTLVYAAVALTKLWPRRRR